MRRVVGRREELRALEGLLGAPGDQPTAVVLEGEAGIGKSTLWLAAGELARERGLRVLSSRPAEAERDLAFTVLADLFEHVVGEVAQSLPPPRRRALETALLVSDETEAVDPRALGLAVRNALELLAAREPLVVEIDDVQWLDRASSDALSFAVRRLECPVVFLLARRVARGIEISDLERAFPDESVDRLPIGPLSVGAIHALLRERLDRVFARPTLLRIHETSGGNPFYALELARALPPGIDPTQPLPVPETLEGLLSARLAGLPERTRHALVLASALGTAPLKLLQAAGAGDDELEPAVAARIVERDDSSVRFTHPLLASVLYQSLSATERRQAHRSLADVVLDPLDRARHLALSTDRPDTEVAAALEEAAGLAMRRGAVVLAAELGEHALRLTPAAALEDEHRRTIAAGRAHMAAGEVDRARMLGNTLTDSREGTERAEALMFLGELESGRLQDRIELRREALREVDIPTELRALIHQRLALELRFFEGRAAAEEHAHAALELSQQLGNTSLEAGAQAALAMLQFQAGEPEAPRRAEWACNLAEEAGGAALQPMTAFCLSHVLVWSFRLPEARRQLEGIERRWGERDERVSAQTLWYLSLVELWSGRLGTAAEQAKRARDTSILYSRDEIEDPQNVFPIALVQAHQGQLDASRELAEHGLRVADGLGALLPGLSAILGLVGAWDGDANGSIEHFERAEATAAAAGWVEPGLTWWRGEYVEALLELGRPAEAVTVLDAWESAAARLGREWVLAHAVRCGGLLAAARGDVAGACRLLGEAAAAHLALGDPFSRARALLALGVVRRRDRKKRAARDAIEAALAGFEAVEAGGWVRKARTELGRIGGRRREAGLTAAEKRVAALVAEGRTNREVAAALFLGERTVETHLSHIYSKLGVRSRTELARRFSSVS